MIDYTNNGVKVALIRKVKSKEDLSVSPIYWRITHQRKQVYSFTGFSFDKKDWNDFLNKGLRKHKDTKTTLGNYFENVLKPAIDILVSTGSFSFEVLKNTLDKSNTKTLNDAFTAKIEALISDGKIGNSTVYQTTYRALVKFQYYRKLKNRMDKDVFIIQCQENRHMTKGKNIIEVAASIQFSDITVKWLNDCEEFWSNIDMSDSSIGMYMRTLRSLINNKGGDPYLSGVQYPFGVGKYQIPEGGRKETALSIEDIRKIEDYTPVNQSEELAQDVFMFLFYANGMNFGDMCRLQFSNIDAATKEIVFQRKKTLKKGERPVYIYVPILPTMANIIYRIGNKVQDGYIFPFLNGIKSTDELHIKEQINLSIIPINMTLKTIAAALGIDPGLSTGYARNSYITHLTVEEMISPIVVKKMVGHSTKKDVTAGYVNLTPKKRRGINEKLLRDDDIIKKNIAI